MYRNKQVPSSDVHCVSCQQAPETVGHLFCQCAFTKKTWVTLGNFFEHSPHFSNSSRNVDCFQNLKSHQFSAEACKILSFLPRAVCWSIWSTIFQGKHFYLESICLHALPVTVAWSRCLLRVRPHFWEGVFTDIVSSFLV